MTEQRELKRYRVVVKHTTTGDKREFPWLPAYSEKGVAHQAKVQFLGSPLYRQRDYDLLETEVSEIPQG